MISLRTFARAAPRAALRMPSASPCLRPALYRAPRQSILQTRALAPFSTSRLHRDEHSAELATKLAEEIQLEHSEAQDPAKSDENVAAFKANTDWNFDGDVPGSQDVFLTRTYEDETITVQFSVADFNSELLPEEELDPAMGDEEDLELPRGASGKRAAEGGLSAAEQEELADEEDQPQPFPVSVNVLIERPGGKGALKFLLTANEQQFVIEQLIHLPPAAVTDAKAVLRETPDDLYVGPPFQQLDEGLQGMMEHYLDARGISMELASVIPEYIDTKEQQEYVGWLERVKGFLE